MKFFLLLTLVTVATAQTLWTDAFVYWAQNPVVQEGSFEALFKDELVDPSNSCWNAFNQMRFYYAKLPGQEYFSRPSTFFQTLKKYIESFTLLMAFYWRCDLERVNLELAQQFKSVSGLASFGIKLVFTYLSYIKSQEWTNQLVDAIDKANYSGLDEDWKRVGVPIGEVLAYMANYEIPNYDFVYGDNARNYW